MKIIERPRTPQIGGITISNLCYSVVDIEVKDMPLMMLVSSRPCVDCVPMLTAAVLFLE